MIRLFCLIMATCLLVSCQKSEVREKVGDYESNFGINKTTLVWNDNGFEKAVEQHFNKTSKEISILDLEEIKTIRLCGGRIGFNNNETFSTEIKSLLDLSKFSHVAKLEIVDCEFSTIEYDNISQLEKLQILYLEQLSINNVNFLKELSELRELFLQETQVTDILEVSKLAQLEKLVLEQNNISEISALSELYNLTFLRIVENEVIDLVPLKGLRKMKDLCIIGEISNALAISELGSLETLDLEFNTLQDEDIFSNLKSLKSLTLIHTNAKDVSFLGQLTNLEYLILDNNFVEDITSLEPLVNLKYLSLRDNMIRNINPLKNLLQLEFLDLSENYVSDLSIVSHVEEILNSYKSNDELGYSPI